MDMRAEIIISHSHLEIYPYDFYTFEGTYLHAYDILMIYVMIVIHVRTLRWLICLTRMTNTHGREFANQI